MSPEAIEWIALVASLDQQGAATGFVEGVGVRHAVATADTLRLTLVVEELFTNVVTHGCHDGRAVAVRIGLQIQDHQVMLCFEDAAAPFDPRRQLPQAMAELEAEAGDRPIGHLGLPLVFSIAHSVDYERSDGWNRLRLTLTRAN
jgi:serine/threonine-protein kinase RsbW